MNPRYSDDQLCWACQASTRRPCHTAAAPVACLRCDDRKRFEHYKQSGLVDTRLWRLATQIANDVHAFRQVDSDDELLSLLDYFAREGETTNILRMSIQIVDEFDTLTLPPPPPEASATSALGEL